MSSPSRMKAPPEPEGRARIKIIRHESRLIRHENLWSVQPTLGVLSDARSWRGASPAWTRAMLISGHDRLLSGHLSQSLACCMPGRQTWQPSRLAKARAPAASDLDTRPASRIMGCQEAGSPWSDAATSRLDHGFCPARPGAHWPRLPRLESMRSHASTCSNSVSAVGAAGF